MTSNCIQDGSRSAKSGLFFYNWVGSEGMLGNYNCMSKRFLIYSVIVKLWLQAGIVTCRNIF